MITLRFGNKCVMVIIKMRYQSKVFWMFMKKCWRLLRQSFGPQNTQDFWKYSCNHWFPTWKCDINGCNNMLTVDVLYSTQDWGWWLYMGESMIQTFWNPMANLESSISMVLSDLHRLFGACLSFVWYVEKTSVLHYNKYIWSGSNQFKSKIFVYRFNYQFAYFGVGAQFIDSGYST